MPAGFLLVGVRRHRRSIEEASTFSTVLCVLTGAPDEGLSLFGGIYLCTYECLSCFITLDRVRDASRAFPVSYRRHHCIATAGTITPISARCVRAIPLFLGLSRAIGNGLAVHHDRLDTLCPQAEFTMRGRGTSILLG